MLATWLGLGVCAVVLVAVGLCARRMMRTAAGEAERWRRALQTMAYEAANAANAIRGHVAALRHTTLSNEQAAHLGEIEEALERIRRALEQARNPAAAAPTSPVEPAAPRMCTPV